jgi:hypothetical protein
MDYKIHYNPNELQKLLQEGPEPQKKLTFLSPRQSCGPEVLNDE